MKWKTTIPYPIEGKRQSGVTVVPSLGRSAHAASQGWSAQLWIRTKKITASAQKTKS